MFISLRSCRKHFIVRSYGVLSDLPCEQCMAKTAQDPIQNIPKIYKEKIPQYIYKNVNYLDKMWIDLNFLNENLYLKKMYNGSLDIDYNPLLLYRNKLNKNINDLRNRFSSDKSTLYSLNYLKGNIEQVCLFLNLFIIFFLDFMLVFFVIFLLHLFYLFIFSFS